jgi:hypothetical protein
MGKGRAFGEQVSVDKNSETKLVEEKGFNLFQLATEHARGGGVGVTRTRVFS